MVPTPQLVLLWWPSTDNLKNEFSVIRHFCMDFFVYAYFIDLKLTALISAQLVLETDTKGLLSYATETETETESESYTKCTETQQTEFTIFRCCFCVQRNFIH